MIIALKHESLAALTHRAAILHAARIVTHEPLAFRCARPVCHAGGRSVRPGTHRIVKFRYIGDSRHTSMEGDALIPPGSTPDYEVNRSRFLEYLYKLDGRDNPAHPDHALYTGLAMEYRVRIGQQIMDHIVTNWGALKQEFDAHLTALEASESEACSPIS